MTRHLLLRGENLARTVTYERDGPMASRDEEHPRRSRRLVERPVRGERVKPTAKHDLGGAVPIHPSAIRSHRLALTGELRHDNAVALEAVIDELCGRGVNELILDLKDLREIDPIGASVLALRCSLCAKRGVQVELRNAARAVREILLRAGLDERLRDGETGEGEHGASTDVRRAG